MCIEYLTVKCSSSVWGHSVHFYDLVSTFDLNIRDLCTAKFIHYWYSCNYQVTKQDVKAPGPLVEILNCLKNPGRSMMIRDEAKIRDDP